MVFLVGKRARGNYLSRGDINQMNVAPTFEYPQVCPLFPLLCILLAGAAIRNLLRNSYVALLLVVECP